VHGNGDEIVLLKAEAAVSNSRFIYGSVAKSSWSKQELVIENSDLAKLQSTYLIYEISSTGIPTAANIPLSAILGAPLIVAARCRNKLSIMCTKAIDMIISFGEYQTMNVE